MGPRLPVLQEVVEGGRQARARQADAAPQRRSAHRLQVALMSGTAWVEKRARGFTPFIGQQG